MNSRTKKGLGIAGATLAATMAAAAAAYLYVGKNAPQRRKKVATWMKAAEREIIAQSKKMKSAAFSEANYRKVTKMVADKYRQARNIDPADVREFVGMMAKSWERAGRAAKSSAVGRGISSRVKKAKKKVSRSRR